MAPKCCCCCDPRCGLFTMMIIEVIYGLAILVSIFDSVDHESVNWLLAVIFEIFGLILVIGLVVGICGVVKQNHKLLLAASISYLIRSIVSIIAIYFYYTAILDTSQYVTIHSQDIATFSYVLSSIMTSIPCFYSTYICFRAMLYILQGGKYYE